MDSSRPIIIGLFGIPGCGKSKLLSELRSHIDFPHALHQSASDIDAHYAFHDMPGKMLALCKERNTTLDAINETKRLAVRSEAINATREDAFMTGRVTVVTGHFFSCSPLGQNRMRPIFNEDEFKTFTHFIYVDEGSNAPTENTAFYRVETLKSWNQAEQQILRDLCPRYGVLYTVLTGVSLQLKYRVLNLVQRFSHPSTDYGNMNTILDMLNDFGGIVPHANTSVVINADQVLSEVDTDAMLWRALFPDTPRGTESIWQQTQKAIFDGPLGSSYNASYQAALLYEMPDGANFYAAYRKVARSIVVPEPMVSLLRAADQPRVATVVITNGLAFIWQLIFKKLRLADPVTIIGNGMFSNGANYVVPPYIKEIFVEHLRERGLRVWAFGSAPSDMPMLRHADQAVFVPTRNTRNNTAMGKFIDSEIKTKGFLTFRPLQVRQSPDAPPCLDTKAIPVVRLDSRAFHESIARNPSPLFRVLHCRGNTWWRKPSIRIGCSTLRDNTSIGKGYVPTRTGEHYFTDRQTGRHLMTWNAHLLLDKEVFCNMGIGGLEPVLVDRSMTVIDTDDDITIPMSHAICGRFTMYQNYPEQQINRYHPATTAAELRREFVENQRWIFLVLYELKGKSPLMEYVERIKEFNADAKIRVVVFELADELRDESHEVFQFMKEHGVKVTAFRVVEQALLEAAKAGMKTER